MIYAPYEAMHLNITQTGTSSYTFQMNGEETLYAVFLFITNASKRLEYYLVRIGNIFYFCANWPLVTFYTFFKF